MLWRHARENFDQALAQRAARLPAPIQVADALSPNFPKLPEKLKVIVATCNVRARRHLVDALSNFPEVCRYALESLAGVYGCDAQAEERGLSPAERLRFHQAHSGSVMEKLHGRSRGNLRRRYQVGRVKPIECKHACRNPRTLAANR